MKKNHSMIGTGLRLVAPTLDNNDSEKELKVAAVPGKIGR